MTSICCTCTKCSLQFNNESEYLKHVQTKHLKSLIINTDTGCTVAFSRVGPGKFTCPTCYSSCKDINDVLSHLLCEEIAEKQSDYLEKLKGSVSKSKTSNSACPMNDNYIDQNYFDFLLTSDSTVANQSTFSPEFSQNLASDLITENNLSKIYNRVKSSEGKIDFYYCTFHL